MSTLPTFWRSGKAVSLGGLADYFSRKQKFVTELIIFCTFFALLILCFNFGMGFGRDDPTARMIISKNTSSLAFSQLVLGAFAFQAVGASVGTSG